MDNKEQEIVLSLLFLLAVCVAVANCCVDHFYIIKCYTYQHVQDACYYSINPTAEKMICFLFISAHACPVYLNGHVMSGFRFSSMDKEKKKTVIMLIY